MEKSWKITLSDGTQLKDLKLSGNNYISKINYKGIIILQIIIFKYFFVYFFILSFIFSQSLLDYILEPCMKMKRLLFLMRL